MGLPNSFPDFLLPEGHVEAGERVLLLHVHLRGIGLHYLETSASADSEFILLIR